MRENTLDTTRTLPQLLRFVAPSIVMMLAMGIAVAKKYGSGGETGTDKGEQAA